MTWTVAPMSEFRVELMDGYDQLRLHLWQRDQTNLVTSCGHLCHCRNIPNLPFCSPPKRFVKIPQRRNDDAADTR